jgi:hypothetical protein
MKPGRQNTTASNARAPVTSPDQFSLAGCWRTRGRQLLPHRVEARGARAVQPRVDRTVRPQSTAWSPPRSRWRSSCPGPGTRLREGQGTGRGEGVLVRADRPSTGQIVCVCVCVWIRQPGRATRASYQSPQAEPKVHVKDRAGGGEGVPVRADRPLTLKGVCVCARARVFRYGSRGVLRVQATKPTCVPCRAPPPVCVRPRVHPPVCTRCRHHPQLPSPCPGIPDPQCVRPGLQPNSTGIGARVRYDTPTHSGGPLPPPVASHPS